MYVASFFLIQIQKKSQIFVLKILFVDIVIQ